MADAPRFSLYELTQEMLALQSAIEADAGELTPATEAALDAISVDLVRKAEGYVAVIRNLESVAEAVKAEEDRLKLWRQTKENAVKRLKDRLHEAMVNLHMDRIDTLLGRLSVCKNSRPSIEWVGKMEELPIEYKRIKTEVDKDAALTALKAGKQLPSQFQVTQGTHLRIG